MAYRQRLLPVEAALAQKSVLLLGPRRTGKSSVIRAQFANHKTYNLLQSDIYLRLAARPTLIRESLTPQDRLVIIDGIQKLPPLLDEVHEMIEAHGVRFLLTGSSARKLRRAHTSFMAGRAKVMRLLPFVSAELETWDLATVLLYGTIPGIYFCSDRRDELQSYVGDYLREEIQAEALARRVEGFSRFLQRAAQSNTEIINFEQVARDALVPSRTVREYYQILEDTLVGVMLECFAAPGKRKAISRGKFYFFDSGVVHALTNTWTLPPGSSLFGRAFEQFIFQELYAYSCMQGCPQALQFWRSTTHQEVDFVCHSSVGIEVKATQAVHAYDLKGLQALHQQSPLAQRILVSQDPLARTLDGVAIMPYRAFLQALWQGELF